VATEDIGGLYNTKQPGYDDAADIQAALKAFLYGSYDYDTTSTDPTQLPNPSLAHHLQGLKDRIQDQEDLGIGSDYLTLAQIAAIASPADGYIAMASDSNGGAVESLYASAFYSNEAPTTDIVDGVLWVDKDSAALDTYVYDSTLLPGDPWVRINDLKNIIQAKGDILIGTGSEGLDNLAVGANGTVLTADDTQTLGVKWQAPVVYSQPTLGSTAIASGATVTNVNDLTINSTTIPTSKTLVATDSTAYVVPSTSGNSGKYLTNDGSTPSWATLPTSGSMTLLSTTTLSGATTTISSIDQNYRNLYVVVTGAYVGTGGYQLNCYVNGDTSSVHNYAGYYLNVGGGGVFSNFGNQNWPRIPISPRNMPTTSTVNDIYMLTFKEYASTGHYKMAEITGEVDTGYVFHQVVSKRNTAAISSITFTPNGTTFSGGTVKIYGVK